MLGFLGKKKDAKADQKSVSPRARPAHYKMADIRMHRVAYRSACPGPSLT